MKVPDQGNVKVTRTVCLSNCPDACGVLAHVKNGVLTKIEPADFPEPHYRYSCRKSLCTPRLVYHPDRLKHPMKRVGEKGEGKWQRISWNEALDTIASRLKDISAKYGPESLGMLMGGLNIPSGGLFSGQRFASVSGATWVNPQAALLASQICADTLSYGMRWSESYHLDHENPRMCVYWGTNIVSAWPARYRHLARPAREKGARMVAISPVFTPTAAKVDQWIPIRPGTDAALALGMINLIISQGLCDENFLIDHTVAPFLVRSDNGLYLREGNTPSKDATARYLIWDTKSSKPQSCDTPGVSPALKGIYTINGVECRTVFHLLSESVKKYPVEKVSEITEITPDVIRRFALDYATLKPVVTERGLALNRSFYGDLAFRAITTLAAITGNICLKRPIFPAEALNLGPFIAPAGRVYKQVPSYQFYENHLTGKPYPIKALWVSSHNPANSHPNSNNFKKLMLSMEFTVVVDLFMSATAELADIVLPGCTTYECTSLAIPWQTCYGGHPYLQLQPKLIEPLYESRSDLDIFTDLARRMGLGELFDKSSEEYIELLLSSGHPSMEGITLKKLKESPMKPKPCSLPLFNTPSGRLEFYVEKLKEFGQELPVYIEPPESPRQPLAQKYPLTFLQLHSKARSHSFLNNIDWLKEIDPEPVVDMNPIDAEKRGLRDGDMVITFNDRGMMKLKARIHEGIRPGVVTIAEGWQPKHFAQGSYQELTGPPSNRAQQAIFASVGQIQGILVEVKKAWKE